MDVTSSRWSRRLNGTVKVIPLPKHLGTRPTDELAHERYLYLWQPPYQISVQLPDWYQVAIECTLDCDGVHQFSLVDEPPFVGTPLKPSLAYITDTTGLAPVASLGGHELLLDRGKVDRGSLLIHGCAGIDPECKPLPAKTGSA